MVERSGAARRRRAAEVEEVRDVDVAAEVHDVRAPAADSAQVALAEAARLLRTAGEGIVSDRGTTISVKRVSKRALQMLARIYPEADAVHAERPKTRGECEGGARPCPYVSCKYNLYLTIAKNGNMKFNHGGLEPWEVPESDSCVLDIADRNGLTLEAVGAIMNLTRERIRQLEDAAFARAKARLSAQSILTIVELLEARGG